MVQNKNRTNVREDHNISSGYREKRKESIILYMKLVSLVHKKSMNSKQPVFTCNINKEEEYIRKTSILIRKGYNILDTLMCQEHGI